MEFYLSKILHGHTIDSAEQVVTEKLKAKGFGVVTYLDVSATLKAKIGVDFRPYRILGACSPHHAHKVLSRHDKVGVMLPCNVCLQHIDDKTVEVFAINPLAAMQGFGGKGLDQFAEEVSGMIQAVLDELPNQNVK